MEIFFQGCEERHDPFRKQPDITAFRTLDYGYTRLIGHNGTHLEVEQVSDDKVVIQTKRKTKVKLQ